MRGWRRDAAASVFTKKKISKKIKKILKSIYIFKKVGYNVGRRRKMSKKRKTTKENKRRKEVHP